MTRTVEVYQVDAFTKRPLTGNPAGVVFGAEGLDDATLLAIARELNNGDTAFAFPADGEDHDLRVRIFTPRAEAGFVGHATLALHTVLAAREGQRVRRQKGRAGIATVRPWNEGHEIRIARAPLGRTIGSDEAKDVCSALGLPLEALDARCPLRIAGTGSTRLLIGVKDAATLARLTPDLSRLATLSASIGAPGYFVFTLAPQMADCDVESRMFCPALGIPEDPVSGNAHGMLAVYLDSLGLLPKGSLRGAQGHFMGRAGQLEIALLSGEEVALRGDARIVFETRIEL